MVVSLGYERLVSDPQVYIHRENRCVLLAHVDDLILATPQEHMQARQHELENAFKVRWTEPLGDNWERYLGKEFKRTSDGYEARIPPAYVLRGRLEGCEHD